MSTKTNSTTLGRKLAKSLLAFALTLAGGLGTATMVRLSPGFTSGKPDVLRNARFDIEPGEIVGLVGRSGSGKAAWRWPF